MAIGCSPWRRVTTGSGSWRGSDIGWTRPNVISSLSRGRHPAGAARSGARGLAARSGLREQQHRLGPAGPRGSRPRARQVPRLPESGAGIAGARAGRSTASRAVASSHNAIGLVLRSQGALAAARAEFEAQLAVQEDLHAREPANATDHRLVGTSLVFIADLLTATGEVPGPQRAWTARSTLPTRWRRAMPPIGYGSAKRRDTAPSAR